MVSNANNLGSEFTAGIVLGRLRFPPLDLAVEALEVAGNRQADGRIDAIINARWNQKSFRFGLDIKAANTPKVIAAMVEHAKLVAEQCAVYPMLGVPYLSDESLKFLESRMVSGLDLCGNGIVVVPGEWLIWRNGQPNIYPASRPIQKVYRGISSLVPRVFLAVGAYRKVSDVLLEILNRGGVVTLPTVSKVIRALEDELVVSRGSGRIRIIQPDKLLSLLALHHMPPRPMARLVGKTDIEERTLARRLADTAREQHKRIVLTGLATGLRAVAGASEPVVSFYTDQHPELLLRSAGIDFQITEGFPNTEIIQTGDPTVYFDQRVVNGMPFSSPIQAFLEMRSTASGDTRSSRLSTQISQQILDSLRADTGVRIET